jgi:hypothetical protein
MNAQQAAPVDAVIDCSALGGIRHILRVRADAHTADDLSLGKMGSAEVSDAEYRLRFNVDPPGFHLLFRINRYTGEGYRQLLNQEGHVVGSHGGDDPIQCSPYAGKPL